MLIKTVTKTSHILATNDNIKGAITSPTPARPSVVFPFGFSSFTPIIKNQNIWNHFKHKYWYLFEPRLEIPLLKQCLFGSRTVWVTSRFRNSFIMKTAFLELIRSKCCLDRFWTTFRTRAFAFLLLKKVGIFFTIAFVIIIARFLIPIPQSPQQSPG